MSNYFVRQENGNNNNDGLSFDFAFSSITKAASVAVSGDVIHIFPGIYFEHSLNIVFGVYLRGYGEVVVDAFGNDYMFTNHSIKGVSNITFRNWSYTVFPTEDWPDRYVYNCSFIITGEYYHKPGLIQAIWIGRWDDLDFYNCLMYGTGLGSEYSGSDSNKLLNCVEYNSNSAAIFGDVNDTYCAVNSNIISNLGTGSFDNSTTLAPPFKDISDPANPDLTYDPTHPNYDLYMTGGENGMRLGRIPQGSALWTPSGILTKGIEYNIASTSPFSDGPWENYSGYYNDGWEDIDIVLDTNDEFSFKEPSGTTRTAKISSATYTDGASFSAAVQTAMQAVGTEATYTVIIGSNKRIEITSDGASLELLCNTEPSSFPAWADMGFETTSDLTGNSYYQGNHALVIGPMPFADANSTFANVDASTGAISLDLTYEATGQNAMAVSPVINTYRPSLISSISFSEIKVGTTSAIDSSQATSERTIYVRGSNKPFLQQDAPSTTQMDWTHIPINTIATSLTSKFTYWQFGAVLRIDATP